MSITLQASGLHTFYNNLSQIPDGALVEALNIIIDRNGVMEPRRGYKQYGTVSAFSTDRARTLFSYKGTILANHAGKLAFDQGDSGTFVDFNGTYNEVVAGLRLRGIEANANFYFTTADGIKKISATSSSQFTSAAGYITAAGGVKALDAEGIVNYTNGGFLTPVSKVAYRIVWGYTDLNDNLILGVPSSILIVTNVSSTQNATVDLTFPIPEQIVNNSSYFYQIYRTQVAAQGNLPSLDDVDPGDEEYLVIQDFPTALQMTAGVVAVNDDVPESIRANGTLLYTNLNSGEGILQANEIPPISRDITLFNGSMIYANTRTKFQSNITLLSVSQLISNTSQFIISDGATTRVYTFRGTPGSANFTFDNKANTNDHGYFLINDANNLINYFVWFDKTNTIGSTSITFDTQANTNDGGYFLFNSANNTDKYVIWLDKTGTTLPPAGADTVGRTLVRVDISTAVTNVDVATAVENVINTLGNFTASLSTATVTIVNNTSGPSDPATNGLSPVGGAAFLIVINNAGNIVVPSGPDTVGRIPIRVDISVGVTTAAQVANAVAVAVNDPANAFNDFTATPVGAVVTIANNDNGPSDNPVNGASPVGGVFAISSIVVGTGEDIPTQHVLLSSAQTPAQQIDASARSLVRVINQDPNGIVYAFYLSSSTDLPGQILLESRNIANNAFYVFANSSTTGSQFSPALPAYKSATVATGTGTVVVTSATHGYINGAKIILFDSTTTPTIDNVYTISNVTTNTFQINATVLVSGSAFIVAATIIATNLTNPNRIYYSKFQQPEAVPIVNFIDIGAKDTQILRVIALRDNLFILKEDGIYRLTGEQEPNFTVSLYDNSSNLIAPDTACVLNNKIYCLTSQGVARINETEVAIISRPIENQVKDAVNITPAFNTVSFGISYESDKSYFLWMPTSSNDTVNATQCFRFNTFTNAWTKWNKVNVGGIVNMLRDNKMYLGAGSQIIEQERKIYDRTDQADYQFDLEILDNAIFGSTINLSSNIGVVTGDGLIQIQYVTISTFNRLLRKLDADIGLQLKDYYSTLNVSPGADLSNAMQLLVNHLNSDSGVQSSYSFSGATDFALIQIQYNLMIDTLNADNGVFQSNYVHSTGTVSQEALVILNIKNTNKVVVDAAPPWFKGPVTHYVSIKTQITYAPQHFQDPSTLKQVSEATMLFEDNIFTTATISYSTDLSGNFESIPFSGVGIGDWGAFTWGEQNWGGDGNQIPIRTLVPLQKQRCRFINTKFNHSNALEKYAILGISFNPRIVSTRGYR